MWYLIGSVKTSSTKEEKAPTSSKDTDISRAEAKVDLKIPVKDVECAKKTEVSKESWVLERKRPANMIPGLLTMTSKQRPNSAVLYSVERSPLGRKRPAKALGQKKFAHVPKKNWQKFSGWKSP